MNANDLQIKELFLSLKGSWHIKRSFSDYGHAKGKAEFIRISPLILDYAEKLEILPTHGKSFEASQCYRYDLKDTKIIKYFGPDKNHVFFYALKFQKPTLATGINLCSDDLYCAEYHFLTPHEFNLIYNIKGKDKNQEIKTSYKKLNISLTVC